MFCPHHRPVDEDRLDSVARSGALDHVTGCAVGAISLMVFAQFTLVILTFISIEQLDNEYSVSP